jgi:hypothetical protein
MKALTKKLRSVGVAAVALLMLFRSAALGIAVAVAALASLNVASAHSAKDTSGHHAFFNDDRSQFVDFWLNDNGNVTMKVSNGRPWRPMHVVVNATFRSGGQVIGTARYYVWCESPTPGGRGNERWHTFAGPGVPGITSVSITTNKTAPKYRGRPHDWYPADPNK